MYGIYIQYTVNIAMLDMCQYTPEASSRHEDRVHCLTDRK